MQSNNIERTLCRLCGPKGYTPCPADSPPDVDQRPNWIDGFNTGFDEQGYQQGVTSTTPDPSAILPDPGR